MRRVIVALVVVGLTIGVVLLWPPSAPNELANIVAGAPTTTSSTTSVPDSTGTTSVGTTSTSPVPESHVVETVEEAEEILRELWFGWFEGIYNQDEERIREVVATDQMLSAGLNAFDSLVFVGQPEPVGIQFIELDLLMSTPDCVAVWSASDPVFLEIDEPRSGVDILRYGNGDWRFASSWRFRDDLWEADCDAELLPLP